MSKTNDSIELDKEAESVDKETVNHEPGNNVKGSTKKAKQTRNYKPRSDAWQQFDKFDDNEGAKRARCKHCGTTYMCASKGYGTSNLIIHLKKCKAYLATIGGGQTQIGFQYGDENKMVSWKFDQKATRKALAHMIVVDELPFRFVEGKGFRHYNSVSQPSFKVPCRSTVTKDVYQLFVEEKQNVRDFIKRNIGRICFTTYSWTSTQQSNYMCLTAHFVDNEWKLTKKVLNFCLLDSHRGVEIGKMIEKCLMDWEIENVLTISVDNASANDVALDFLKEGFRNHIKCLVNGEWTHVRCVAHILNLVVQDGIKKVDRAVDKVRYAVKWIRNSPSRIAKFNKCDELVKCETTKHLIRDIPTRWNSTFNMLEVAQAYEKVFYRYELEELDFGNDLRKAGLDVPSIGDWIKVRNLCHFLKSFYDVTLRVSGTHYVTAHICIDDIASIRAVLNEALNDKNLCEIAMAMKVKFDKYFGEVEKMNLFLYFALVLDPRNKEKYLFIILDDHYGLREEKVVEEKKKYIMDAMHRLYNDYVRIHSPSSSTTTGSSSSMLGKRSNPDVVAPKPPTRNKLREKMKTDIIDSSSELEKYLKESVEDDSSMFDILTWWKVNSPRFPTLSLMARDLLAIPVSTVASESVFSTSGRVLDAFRSSLTPRIVESLVCTQDWLRGSTSAISESLFEEDWETIQQIDKELDGIGTFT